MASLKPVPIAAFIVALLIGDATAEVDYVRDIKPLLKAKCYSCHGSVRQEAGLRLDTAAFVRQGGDSGSAVDMKQLADSLILTRVTAGQDERMPPEGEPLTETQVQRLESWIESGAEGPADEKPQSDPNSHWSFQPVSVDAVSSDRHPIDHWIERRLDEIGLRPAPPADRESLIRRMFLDLHGLPPSPDQMRHWRDRLARDPTEVDRLIDQLLASPRYGERWAQHWLDIVRYADTHGYEVNTPRPNAWPYRDYVIKAFNDDKPYDRFVIEQLAGDALGEDAATGFLVAAAALLPGQIGKDEPSKRLARQDALDEIIVGTSATFLAMTVGCARCHDHKFDPISQSDYYGMQAFFAGVEYGERPWREAGSQTRLRQADALQPIIDGLKDRIEGFRPFPFRGRTIVVDDEDSDRVSLLKPKQGHGENPAGLSRGYRDDVGDVDRVPNLSGGRYTWWQHQPNEDVFSWDPQAEGRFRVWISWGVHGSGVHSRDARYVLDQDGDLSTKDDQKEIAVADQFLFSGQSEGQSEKKPLWSGLSDAGVHDFSITTKLVLRGGETGTGVTADVIVLQEASRPDRSKIDADLPGHSPSTRLPLLREPVSALGTIERFRAIEAKFVRFTTLETIDNNRHEPCIDELEVFSATTSQNIALAAYGTRPTSSGDYSDPGRHEVGHINDGNYGNERSWISDQKGGGWVQLEFPNPETIDRVVWARDRNGKYRDRLPIRYQVETSLDGERWTVVASSDDRVRQDTPFDEVQAIVRGGAPTDETKLRGIAKRIETLQGQQRSLRASRSVYAGKFRTPDRTYVLNRGDPEQPEDEIEPRVISALGTLTLRDGATEQDRRLALANWIASPENPVTGRVIVNRIWQYHFGVGLVETPSDFGINGAVPSHPELLDWLTAEFMRGGWSIKTLHRWIMSSDAYQRSSVWISSADDRADPDLVDADNRLLWKYPSRRIEAEAIRDCILSVSGQLNLAAGGPGFDFFKTRGGLSGFPPVDQFGAAQLRRMIYSHKIRMERVPVFGAFDCPDAGLPTPRRGESTTAIQALNLFNSPFVIDQSERFAERIRQEAGAAVSKQIDHAFVLAFGRAAQDDERAQIEPIVREHGLATLCRVLFNSSEFLFVP